MPVDGQLGAICPRFRVFAPLFPTRMGSGHVATLTKLLYHGYLEHNVRCPGNGTNFAEIKGGTSHCKYIKDRKGGCSFVIYPRQEQVWLTTQTVNEEGSYGRAVVIC